MLTECFREMYDDGIDACQVAGLLLLECSLQARTYKQWSASCSELCRERQTEQRESLMRRDAFHPYYDLLCVCIYVYVYTYI
jgi:hypothetical protein